MKASLLPIALLFAMVAPISQASVISIGDPLPGTPAETITVLINNPGISGGGPPGTGTVVTPANFASLNFTSFGAGCGPGPEAGPCQFIFADHIPWGTDVYLYRYFTEVNGGLSDLFVIQGFGGTNPDIVTFISSDTLTGNILIDGPLPPLIGLPQINLGTLAETGGWQLAFDTGVDQYYIQSDIPEPATLALLSLGLAVLGFSRRKQ